jgi:hypothetical protein
MSGKGGSNNKGNTGGNKGGGNNAPSGNNSGGGNREPTVVSGWEYHQYAQNSDRYAYIGKDEDTGEPEFIDYGPKGGR